MIRKSLVLLVALLAFDLSAHSQAAVYGTFTVQRMSGIKNSPLAVAPYTTSTPAIVLNNTIDPIGGTVGVYYDFKTVGPVRLGVDVRGSEQTVKRGAQAAADGSGGRIYSGLGGIRATFHSPFWGLKPYAQASAGLGRTDYGFYRDKTNGKVVLTNNFEYHVYGGVDLHLLPYIDWRAVELGYGGLNPFGDTSHNYGLFSASTGIVVHFAK